MMQVLGTVLAFGVALAVTLALIPRVLHVAHRKELLDHPDGARHGHETAVPRLGGIAVFGGFVAALLLAWLVPTLNRDLPELPHALALVFGTTILFGVGLLDDLYGVSPTLKLAAQTIAALVMCASGFVIETISFPPSIHIETGWFGIPLTVMWFVGVSNAFNLIDGLDGLAGGVGLIAVAAITVSAGLLDRPFSALCAAAVSGSLLGFLKFNFPPAKIFLGDSGSLTVGFILAFLSVRGAMRTDGSLLAVIPLFALAYPLLDTGVAILRRWLRGHPLSRADSRHIHHQLRSVGLTNRRAVVLIYFHAAVAAVVGLFVAFSSRGLTVAVVAFLAAIAYFAAFGVRRLNYHEFLEAGAIMMSAVSRARGAIRETINARDVANAIQDANNIAEINDLLRESAELFSLAHLQVVPARSAPSQDISWANGSGHMTSPVTWWNLEYPIMRTDGEPVVDTAGTPLALSVACSTESHVRAAAVERIAPVIATAIRTWTEGHLARLRLEPSERPARVSGVHRALDGGRRVRRNSREMDSIARS